MANNLILSIALPTPLRRLFDYVLPETIDSKNLIPGVRIRVPFQRRTLVGILIEVKNKSIVAYEKLKPVLEVIDSESLFSNDVFKLCEWAAEYYHYPLGEVFSCAMPSLLRKGIVTRHDVKNFALQQTPTLAATEEIHSLNPAQQDALNAIMSVRSEFKTFLLDGVTGSGKTEVYLRAIEQTLLMNKQVLVLIPEISLTPQTIARFRARFTVPIVALHSSLSEKARAQAYLSAKTGEVKIVIGTRSAIFTSFEKLGLIIVDEEHDASFKQQERFRYHARDLAVMRANMNNIPIVLGSATPSLESFYNALKLKRYSYLQLPKRAGTAQLPNYEIIDLRLEKTRAGISLSLIEKIKTHLNNDSQVLLFLNKRGFAPVYYCPNCTHIICCKNCDVRLVYHKRLKLLKCHHCDFKMPPPNLCPNCSASHLEAIGIGTERLEDSLRKYFPDIPIIRVDRDNTQRKDAMNHLFAEIHKESKAIILGTQMLAKGHHFPNITLVGIIDADNGFFSVDFRGTEQIGQLLLQVSGRAGRADKPGTVVIQTRNPTHPALQMLLQQGFSTFADYLLTERFETKLPPYSYFAIFRAYAKNDLQAKEFLTALKKSAELFSQSVDIFGPIPALIAKRKGFYCQHLVIKAGNRPILQRFLKKLMGKLDAIPKHLSRVKLILDVDPIEV